MALTAAEVTALSRAVAERPDFEPPAVGEGDGFTMVGGSRKDLKRELYQLAVARSDIEAAFEVCGLLLERVATLPHPLYAALAQAVIVNYARPFTKNRPYGRVPGVWPGYASREFTEVHAEVLAERHKVVAHSDADLRYVEVAVPGGRLAQTELFTGLGAVVSTSTVSLDHFKVLHAASRDLAQRLHVAVEEMLARLYAGLDLPQRSFRLRIDHGL